MDETYILTFALYIENTSLYYVLDKLCATSKKVQQHSVGLGLSKARDCFLRNTCVDQDQEFWFLHFLSLLSSLSSLFSLCDQIQLMWTKTTQDFLLLPFNFHTHY
jgi:hypothetical protein